MAKTGSGPRNGAAARTRPRHDGKGRRLTGVRKQMQWVAPTELPRVGDEENVRTPQPEKIGARKLVPESWCRKEESNLRPTDYESVALPTELFRREGAQLK